MTKTLGLTKTFPSQTSLVVLKANAKNLSLASESENQTLRLLREIRDEQVAMRRHFDETNTKLDAFIASSEKKLDKLSIELIGVKGRVRKVEEAVETIARVMSDGTAG